MTKNFCSVKLGQILQNLGPFWLSWVLDVKNAKNITNWIQKTPQKILVLFGPFIPLFSFSHFLLLFFRFLFFGHTPHIKGAKIMVKRVQNVPKFFGVFFGSNLVYFLHFLHLEYNSIKMAQDFAKYDPIWHYKNF